MPLAAIPHYLRKPDSAKTASPGMRFGLLLPLWDEGANIASSQKVEALKQACNLTPNDQSILNAWLERQAALVRTLPSSQLMVLDAQATAPFTTGLGQEHPLENGFAFLSPYGLPYLPGSGIKGVLRQAALELASGEWGSAPYDMQAPLQSTQSHLSLTLVDLLLGREAEDGSSDHFRGVLSIWDSLPQISGNALQVEVMTPHQSHYYQQKTDNQSGHSTNPHDSGQPIPIVFLTVPALSRFAFHVQCDLPRLSRLAPDWAAADRWQGLLKLWFEHAFTWLGFGAKTAVGYGAMHVDTRAAERRVEAAQQAAKVERMANLSSAMQAIEKFVNIFEAQHSRYPNTKEGPNKAFHGQARTLAQLAKTNADWTSEEKRAAAEAIEKWLPLVVSVDIKDERKKLALNALKGL